MSLAHEGSVLPCSIYMTEFRSFKNPENLFNPH